MKGCPAAELIAEWVSAPSAPGDKHSLTTQFHPHGELYTLHLYRTRFCVTVVCKSDLVCVYEIPNKLWFVYTSSTEEFIVNHLVAVYPDVVPMKSYSALMHISAVGYAAYTAKKLGAA